MSDSEDTPTPPPQPRTHIQFVLDGGAGVNIMSTMTPEQLVEELDTKGGANRTGYASIAGFPKPPNKSETLRVWRQKIIGFVVTDLQQVPQGRILVPTMVPPTDISTKRS